MTESARTKEIFYIYSRAGVLNANCLYFVWGDLFFKNWHAECKLVIFCPKEMKEYRKISQNISEGKIYQLQSHFENSQCELDVFLTKKNLMTSCLKLRDLDLPLSRLYIVKTKIEINWGYQQYLKMCQSCKALQMPQPPRSHI